MYGTKDAARNWEKRYSQFLQSLGFTAGKASPCVFHNPTLQCSCVVHGDDFTFLGNDSALDKVAWQMTQKAVTVSCVCTAGMGAGPGVRMTASVEMAVSVDGMETNVTVSN